QRSQRRWFFAANVGQICFAQSHEEAGSRSQGRFFLLRRNWRIADGRGRFAASTTSSWLCGFVRNKKSRLAGSKRSSLPKTSASATSASLREYFQTGLRPVADLSFIVTPDLIRG